MRKKTALIVLVILALGLIGMGFSTLYTQNEYIGNPPIVTVKESYGFPLGWQGYTFTETGIPYNNHWEIPQSLRIYWFSLESLLLDAAFWFAISFSVSFAAIKSARTLNLVAITRAGTLGMKTSIMLLVTNLFFIVIGAGLCLVARSYLDVGLRLIGSGTIALIATLSVMVRKSSNVTARLEHERMRARQAEMLNVWSVWLCVIAWNGRVSRTAHELRFGFGGKVSSKK